MGEYGSVARFFDGEYAGFRQDVDFYLDRLREERVRGPVLVPGCGTGRVAAPLAAAGFRVSGFDLSQAMLGRARRRRRTLPPEARLRLRFSCQDMARFRYRYPFQAAVLAFSTFNLLADAAARRACLEGLAAHLEPGAVLLADLFNPGTPAHAERRFTSTFRLPPRGHLVEKTVEERDAADHLTTVRYSYRARRWHDDSAVDGLEVEFVLARMSRAEMTTALESGGFDVEAVFGDYAGRPHSERSPRMIFQARRLD